jgi:hypothetical protein
LNLSAIYADYRDDGRGRPAYEPSMMVALLLYAYACGNRSSRAIERACVEDIAFRVVAGNLAPDHSTIADFRCRHERPLGEVFSGVLGLCARAALASGRPPRSSSSQHRPSQAPPSSTPWNEPTIMSAAVAGTIFSPVPSDGLSHQS